MTASEETESSAWIALGRLIRAHRENNALTLADVAEASGLSVSTIQTIEKGGRQYRGAWLYPSPSTRTLIQLFRAIPVPADAYEKLADRFRQLGVAAPTHEAVTGQPISTERQFSVSAHDVDLSELERTNPAAYQAVMDFAQYHLERARERRQS